MGFLIEANPPAIEFEPIEVSIRREQAYVQDIEFDTGVMPSTWYLEYLKSERRRGIQKLPTNI